MVEHKHAGKQETFLKEYSWRQDLARKKTRGKWEFPWTLRIFVIFPQTKWISLKITWGERELEARVDKVTLSQLISCEFGSLVLWVF